MVPLCSSPHRRCSAAPVGGWKREGFNTESKREKDNEREVLNSTERSGGMERIAGRAAEWE